MTPARVVNFIPARCHAGVFPVDGHNAVTGRRTAAIHSQHPQVVIGIIDEAVEVITFHLCREAL